MPKSTLMSAAELEEQFIQKGGSSPSPVAASSKPAQESAAEDEEAIHRFTLRLPKSQKLAIDQVINQSAMLKRLGATHFIIQAIEEKLARETKSKQK